MHFNKILLTTDFSEQSLQAFKLTAYENSLDKTTLILLNVIEDWDVPDLFLRQIPNPETVQQYRHSIKQNAEIELEKLAKSYFKNIPVITKVILAKDAISSEILNYSKAEKIDLIVMSSHGRGALGRIFMGSTVQKIIAEASCPVMIIPRSSEQ